jgi:valyl-tRNA synthetase
MELAVTVKPADAEVAAALRSGLAVIGSLARAAITVSQDGVRPAGSAVATTPSGDVFVRLEGVVDFEAERQRLRKEIERARKEIAFLEGKLGRPEFVERAPVEVVERERERLVEQRQIEQKLTTSLAALE